MYTNMVVHTFTDGNIVQWWPVLDFVQNLFVNRRGNLRDG